MENGNEGRGVGREEREGGIHLNFDLSIPILGKRSWRVCDSRFL